VTIRVRPKIEYELESIYAAFLKESLSSEWEIILKGQSRYLSHELKNDIAELIDIGADLYVINVGCVDAPPREIPLWYSDILFKRNRKWLFPVINLVYNLIKRFNLRKILVEKRGYKPWVTSIDFEQNMLSSIKLLKEATSCKIVLIGINNGNERLENELPGILKQYQLYNKILSKVSSKTGALFIDVSNLNHIDHFPDGVHYNIPGHKLIADKILSIVNE